MQFIIGLMDTRPVTGRMFVELEILHCIVLCEVKVEFKALNQPVVLQLVLRRFGSSMLSRYAIWTRPAHSAGLFIMRALLPITTSTSNIHRATLHAGCSFCRRDHRRDFSTTSCVWALFDEFHPRVIALVLGTRVWAVDD